MFVRLELVRNTEFADEIADLGGAEYLDHYTIPEDYEEVESIGSRKMTFVPTVSIVGVNPGLNINTTQAFKDSNGDIWIDSDLIDEVFF